MKTVRFECQPGCTKCCDQEGFVYLSEQDLLRAAEFVGMTPRAFEAKYIFRTSYEMRFRKPRRKQCPFLEADGCSIHPAKPTQCRTFPFWPEILERKTTWLRAGRGCPGIGKGDLIQIKDAQAVAEEQRAAYPHMYD